MDDYTAHTLRVWDYHEKIEDAIEQDQRQADILNQKRKGEIQWKKSKKK